MPIILRMLAIIYLLFVLQACGDKPHADERYHYVNVDCRIVEFGMTQTHGKYGSEYKMVLLQLLSDTTMYMEYSQHGHPSFADADYYNWEKGDTLHWDFVRKDRFFKIEKRTHM